MDFLAKLKETLMSVLPIVGIVLLLNFTIAPLGSMLWPFLVGALMLVVGLSLFLAGTDIGMAPVGEKLGSVLAHRRNVAFMLAIGFTIGLVVTLAEPDVTVLARQVNGLNPAISEKLLILMIAVGLGLFLCVGLLRTVLGFHLKWVLIISYLIVFVLVSVIGQSMASISFDASGATTGPLAVPFILALGLGVSASTSHDKGSSFGLTGIASVGPILAVATLAMMASSSPAEAESIMPEAEAVADFGDSFIHTLKSTTIGFGPLALIIFVLQFALLRFPKIKLRKVALGIVYSFIGIVIFLTGVDFGFVDVGRYLGQTISQNYSPALVIVLALVFGGIVVIAEPAVWVLTNQVENVTAGRIRKRMVMAFICLGVAVAVALAMVRIYLRINYLWFVFIGVGSALIMSFFTPALFAGLAFDSGGVASGRMSTTFLLSFALGVSGSADMGFGLVGLIAISPLIAIQILGILFRIKEGRARKEAKHASS